MNVMNVIDECSVNQGRVRPTHHFRTTPNQCVERTLLTPLIPRGEVSHLIFVTKPVYTKDGQIYW